MKLWFQVLFAQGYLLRRLFPDEFPKEKKSTRANLAHEALAVLYAILGAVLIYRGSPIYGSALTLTGLAWAIWSSDSLGFSRFFGSRAFWTSLSWAAATATVIGWFLIAILSAIFRVWLGLVIFAAFFGFFGTMSLRSLERRYLFFAQRNSAWDIDPAKGTFVEWCVDTYWRLPREIARTMFRRPKELR